MSLFAVASPVPNCAKCGGPVQLFSSWRDEYKRVTVYQAECHGETQRVEIRDVDLISADRIDLGQAFAAPALPANEPVMGLLRG